MSGNKVTGAKVAIHNLSLNYLKDVHILSLSLYECGQDLELKPQECPSIGTGTIS